jgi:toxin ParE1/3/4
MKVIYTETALGDLDNILTYLGSNFPTVTAAFVDRIRAIEQRIGRWPESGQEVEQRTGVRVVPLIRFPYKVFYRVSEEAVEILHIRHAARQDPGDDERQR